MNDITIKNISHSYDKEKVLDQVDITIQQGEFFTLLGPSGCGKTTLLRILAGFIEPTEGSILIGEKDITHIPPEKRNMGVVFQDLLFILRYSQTDFHIAFRPFIISSIISHKNNRCKFPWDFRNKFEPGLLPARIICLTNIS